MKKLLLEVFVLLMAALVLLLLCGQQPTAAQPLLVAGTATPPSTPQPAPTPQPAKPSPSATSEPPGKILFIGESLISWNNGLDQHIEQLAASASPPLVIEADIVTIGRGSLEKIWKESNAAEIIDTGHYDVVVLQEDLWGTDVSTFHEYARKFDAEIKKTGAETVLFMPWQIDYLELTIDEIAQAHRDIAPELGADVAPVGLAWQQAMEERPELKLVGPDGIHPSIHGTYLATNVVYATVFGQSPNSTAYLPAAPNHDCATEKEDEGSHDPALDAYAGKRVRGCITEEEAAFLQRIAWETVQEYTTATATPTPQPTQPAPLTSYNLNSVWGSSGQDVFAVGELGTILHYDGSAWSKMDSGSYSFLTTVWGSSPSDVFVDGWDGAILHYDGSSWSSMASGTTNRLWGVWGSSGDDVFAFGDGGTILHYDGKSWSPMDSGTSNTLTTGWGSSGQDVFVVGWNGTILHYDGRVWTPVNSGTSSDLWGVWGSSGSNIFVAGEKPSTILHYDGKAWSTMDSGTTKGIWGMWVDSDREAFIVGELGTILHYDGDAWSTMDSGTEVQELTTVWGSSGSDVFAVGYSGTILHYDGTAWLDMSSGTLTTTLPLTPTVTLDSALVAKIEAAITETMKVNQIPGLAIGIIKDGQVAYTKGFGLAEVGTDRMVTPETVFQLASNSKTVVVTAIMQLKEQGKIDLDAPVTDYLPYFRLADERYKEITIRHLLSHRAGLPYSMGIGYSYYVSDYQSPEYDEGSLERHVRNLSQLKLQSAPGGEFGHYSDLGFEILGDVIAKVSGQSFEAYTQEHIFAPLGMQHTSFMVRDIPPELLAAPHGQQGSKIVVNNFFPYSRQHAPSSTLLSNVDDMNRFALAQLNRGQLGEARILPDAAYEEMWGTTYGNDSCLPNETGHGLGWFIGELAGHRLVDYGGLDIGFHSEFRMMPDDGLGVVIMANRDYDSWQLQSQVLLWLLEAKG